ncbi:MAG: hypothetical protein ACLGIG_08385 [Actinomycetes bacterium]
MTASRPDRLAPLSLAPLPRPTGLRSLVRTAAVSLNRGALVNAREAVWEAQLRAWQRRQAVQALEAARPAPPARRHA